VSRDGVWWSVDHGLRRSGSAGNCP
jgi:hypothetical protein